MAASAQRIEGFSLKDSVVRMVLKGSLSETNQAGGRRELQGEGRCAKQQGPFLLLAAFIHLNWPQLSSYWFLQTMFSQ